MEFRNVFQQRISCQTNSNVFCYDFGRFPLAAREIQNEDDTWHCASFNGLRLMKSSSSSSYLFYSPLSSTEGWTDERNPAQSVFMLTRFYVLFSINQIIVRELVPFE